jgi:uncharacterized repeat protein (TIGR01451 family)/CSLREA domain-containing protein
MARLPRRGARAFTGALLLVLMLATQASAKTYTVDSTADDGAGDAVTACETGAAGCTLRAAVNAANSSEEADTIDLPAGRYVRSGQQNEIFIGASGALTIVGAGARTTTIDANGQGRVLELGQEATLAISGVTIRGGAPCGEGCVNGGGILVLPSATLEMTDSVVTRNRANSGGGIAATDATVALTRVSVTHNLASSNGGGVWNDSGYLTVTGSTFDNNIATDGAGGGIANELYIPESRCVDCEYLTAPAGDMAAPEQLRMPGYAIDGSTLSDNASLGRMDGGGGALSMRLTGDAFGPRRAELQYEGSVVNSTVSGNVAQRPGGAISHQFGTLSLESDTITNGDARFGGGLIETGDGVDATARNTIFASGTSEGEALNCNTPITSLGNNLESGESCGLNEPTDTRNAEPALGPLADNGGLTWTHALADGSPAIDKGANGEDGEFDQRGGDRPPAGGSAGEVRDIGAFEAGSLADVSVDVQFDAPDPATAGQPLTYSLLVRNDGPDKASGVTLTSATPAGTELVSADGFALGAIEPGTTRAVQIVVRPTAAGTVTNTATVAATGITDTDPANNSATATTQVNAAPAQQPQQPEQPQQIELDGDVEVDLKAPKTVTIDQFFDGIVVEADCKDEPCLRRFREHAAINTGATRIAGYNLTVSRAYLARSAKRTKARLRPCQSGATKGRRHKRCLKNLRKAAEKAGTFNVKVVVSVVDAAGNKAYAKRIVKVTP